MPETAYDITQPYLGIIKKYRPKPNEVDPETQRKIAKGNAVAEAFRLLLDYSGAKKGANVQQRDEPSNAITTAVENYYKAKDQNRAEQGDWDRMELGTEIDALRSKAQQDFTTATKQEDREFTENQAKAQRDFTAEEKQKDRDLSNAELRNKSDEFLATLGLKRAELSQRKTEQEADTETKRQQIASNNIRYLNTRPYGYDKGIWISDPDVQTQVHIPDDKRAQVLAYINADPNVQDQIPIIKLGFGNVPPEAQAEYLIAQTYSSLSKETRDQIRQFVGSPKGQGPATTSTSQPQTPTITNDKGSKTMLTVEQPTQQEQSESGLTPEEKQGIVKIQSDTQLETKDKASLIYKLLVKQGYDPGDAKTFVESLYPELKRK